MFKLIIKLIVNKYYKDLFFYLLLFLLFYFYLAFLVFSYFVYLLNPKLISNKYYKVFYLI